MLRLYLLCRPDRTLTVAQRMIDLIRSRYRGAEIVWDVPAADAAFAWRVEATMRQCNALLIVVGPDWLQARSPRGLPWQDDPSDPVAVGLVAALRQKKLIVPLLVHGATMPSAGDLALPLAEFALHQAVTLREDPLFLTDLQKVYTQLNTQLTWRPASTLLLLIVIGTVLSFAVIAVIAFAFTPERPSGLLFVIEIIASFLYVALGLSALIVAFVLTVQRKQMGWLAALIALTLITILLIAGAITQGLDWGAILIPWQLLSDIVIAVFALFGKRREMA